MQQNIRHNHTGAIRYKKRKKRRNYFIVLIIGLGAVTYITVFAMRSPTRTIAKVEVSNSSGVELQTEQKEQPQSHTTEDETNSDKSPVVTTEYDYSKPAPESDMVENSYFDDAVFIGDSRTEGFLLYSGLSNAISYTNQGLMVDTLFTKPVINMNGSKISVMDALRQTDFTKVYIMLGINETGWPYNSVFIQKYGKVVDEIKAINPEAIIYVQEILPVTDKVSQTHSYVKNEKINEYNALIRQMAKEKEIYYIDVGKSVANADGTLPEEAASDGIHLKKPYCDKWLEYLKTHTVTNTER